MSKVRFELVIEADSDTCQLFAAGVSDLKSYFVPMWTNAKEEDVKVCKLFLVGENGLYTHYDKDNYISDEERKMNLDLFKVRMGV